MILYDQLSLFNQRVDCRVKLSRSVCGTTYLISASHYVTTEAYFSFRNII